MPVAYTLRITMPGTSSKELKAPHAFVPVQPPKTMYYCFMWGLQLIAAPVLFPFRLLAMLLSFAIASVSLRILTLKLDLTRPVNPFRRALIRLQTMFFTWIFVWSTGCRVTEKDVQNKPDSETDHVLIYNHTNSLDGAILAMLGFTSHINKASIRRMPVFGLVEASNQGLFVDRGDSSSREYVQKAIQERTLLASGPLGLPREWPIITGAPEGTTTNGTALITFKRGLFVPGKPVHTCYISYDRRLLDASDAHQNMVVAILKMMLCFRTACTVRYLPKYVPTTQELDDPDLYATNVRYYFHVQTGLPLLDMTGSDKQYYRRQHNDINRCSNIAKGLAECRSGSGHYVAGQ